MSNRKGTCQLCKKKTVVSIFYRIEDGKNRPRKLAFLICPKCPFAFNFIDTKYRRTMPYYNDISNLFFYAVIEIEDKKALTKIKYDRFSPCIKCGENEYARLYAELERKIQDYVGYLCKKCNSAYILNNSRFHLKRRNDEGFVPEYVGSFVTRPGVPFGEPEMAHYTVSIPQKKIKGFKKCLKKYNCEILSQLGNS